MRFSFALFIALIFAMMGYSCKEKGRKYIDQGEIHFNVDYTGIIGVPKELLPQNLVVSFKNDKILWEMIGIGNSGIINLANPDKGIFDTYYSFFTRKYFYTAQPGELFPGFEAMNGMIIRKTLRKEVICGFNCKNAEVTFSNNKEKVHNIWYTDEIKIKDPNASTPFYQIDGVLLSFFFFLGPTELHFNAESVYKKDIPDEAFERKDKFARISKEEINKFINRMINL